MIPEDLKYDALKNSFDNLSNKVDSLTNSVKANEKSIGDDKKEKTGLVDKFEGWIKNITLLLSIPGIIVVLFIQLRQPENVKADTESKLADARQKNAQALKTEQEIKFALDTVLNQKSKEAEAYRDLLNDKLPQLQDVVTRFENANLQKQNQQLIYKYIIVWVIFVGLGWFFGLFSTFWSSLIGATYFFFLRRSDKIKNNKSRERTRNISQYLMLILSPLPTIIKIIIEISIFVAVMIPIFNETAALLGSDKSFTDVLQNFSHFEINKAIDDVRSILFKK